METKSNLITSYVPLNEVELQEINGGGWGIAALITAALLSAEELGERAGRALYHAIN